MENTLNPGKVTNVGVGQKWEEPVNETSQIKPSQPLSLLTQLTLISPLAACLPNRGLVKLPFEVTNWLHLTNPVFLLAFIFVLDASFDTIACLLEFLCLITSMTPVLLFSHIFPLLLAATKFLAATSLKHWNWCPLFLLLYIFSPIMTTHSFQASDLPSLQIPPHHYL